jgi:hypothetical protein
MIESGCDDQFEAVDEWPAFTALLTSRYDLNMIGHEDYIFWRFYLRRPAVPDAQIR